MSVDKQEDETALSKPKPRTALFKRVKVVAQNKAVEPGEFFDLLARVASFVLTLSLWSCLPLATTKEAEAALPISTTPAGTPSSSSGNEAEPPEESSSDFGIRECTFSTLSIPNRESSLTSAALLPRLAHLHLLP